jgi:hypothetical protein
MLNRRSKLSPCDRQQRLGDACLNVVVSHDDYRVSNLHPWFNCTVGTMPTATKPNNLCER